MYERRTFEMINFDNCEYSVRHGEYGGQAGDKDGILYNNEYWIIKYPKTTRGMMGNNLNSYTTSPLSEYIGSHIYDILGVDVHETILGEKGGKIVVACKDFRKTNEILKEVRNLKNAANQQIQESVGENFPLSATGDTVNLNELLLHFEVNPLMQLKGLEERFWKCVIIDIFINNSDRNNGNWGVLTNEITKEKRIAPVYDNGNSFNNKIAEDKIFDKLNDINALKNDAIGTRTAYFYNDKCLSARKMLNLAMTLEKEHPKFKEQIKETIPVINEKFNEILRFIEELPTEYNGKVVCSEDRKMFYTEALIYRYTELLEPIYEKVTGKKLVVKAAEHQKTENDTISSKKNNKVEYDGD